MKVQATTYKGIEFVSLQDLPADQQLLLQHNNEVDRIKILIDGKVSNHCIQYKDYSAWYANVFTKSVPSVKESVEVSVQLEEIAIAKI